MGPAPDSVWAAARQMGVDYAAMNLPNTVDDEKPWEYAPLRRMKSRANDHGFDVQVIEEQPPMEKIRLGQEGRDREIEYVTELLENMGKLDIPVWGWGWSVHFPVLRTSKVRLRGGSVVSAFNRNHLEDSTCTDYHNASLEEEPQEVTDNDFEAVDSQRYRSLSGQLRADHLPDTAPSVSKEELWENMQYFLDAIVPVAEEAGVKLALHPDDPPTSPIYDVDRIITSVDAYDRVLDMYQSDHHGLCLAQGNFSAMGADIPAAIRRFDDRINFVHFRDVNGGPDDFYETWHDDGQTDMAECIAAYRDVGFEGPIRPDHYPTVTAGDGNGHFKGRLFATGYVRGLIDQAELGDS